SDRRHNGRLDRHLLGRGSCPSGQRVVKPVEVNDGPPSRLAPGSKPEVQDSSRQGGMFGIPQGFAPLARFYRVPLLVLVGEIAPKPWAVDGRVEVRPVLGLTAAIDH